MALWKLGERKYSFELSHHIWEAANTIFGFRHYLKAPVSGGSYPVRMSKEYQ
jgi:hypothetical protein